VVEAGVDATGGDELIVGSAFDDPTVIDDGDLVGVADRGQAVGDDDRRPSLQGDRQRILYRRLGAGVEMGGGLVEHDDAGIFEEQSSDGDALLLAARHAVPAVADDGVEPGGEAFDHRPDLGGSQRRLQLAVGGVGPGVAEVGAQRVVEQVDVLGDDADRRPHVGQRAVAQVDAAEADGPGGRVVQARDEPGDRRLPGSGRADQRQRPARLDPQ